MRRLSVLAVGVAAALTLSLSSASAFAAVAYPPPPTGPTVTCAVGATVSMTYTGFKPSTSVSFVVNGTQDATTTTGPDGTVTVSVHCTDPHIAVNGGTPIAAVFGNNSNNGVGTGPSGQALTVAGTVIIPNSATTPTTTVQTAGGAGSTGTGSSSSGSGSLAFTGADIGAMVVGGLALIAMGFGLVTITRRRRHTHI